MAAPIGNDLPERVREAVVATGFSTAALAPRNLPTLRNRVVYAADGSRAWTLCSPEEEFESLSPTPDDLPPGYCAAEAFLVLAMALGAQERLIEWMRAQTNALVALDPQEDYIAGNHSRLRSLIGKVDIFLPSAEEVRRLTGGGDWTTASRDFAALGPRPHSHQAGRRRRHGIRCLARSLPADSRLSSAPGGHDRRGRRLLRGLHVRSARREGRSRGRSPPWCRCGVIRPISADIARPASSRRHAAVPRAATALGPPPGAR